MTCDVNAGLASLEGLTQPSELRRLLGPSNERAGIVYRGANASTWKNSAPRHSVWQPAPIDGFVIAWRTLLLNDWSPVCTPKISPSSKPRSV